MNTYFINEYGKDMTYLELRLCAILDCPGRIKKITEILNFLNIHNFLTNLVVAYDDTMRSENFEEKSDIASLSIDVRDDKFRFKYWNGSETIWTFHTQDLFDSLISGREDYAKIYAKYYPVTTVIKNMQDKFRNSIKRITYRYYPQHEVEMIYHLVFTQEIQETHAENSLLEMINKEIIMLGSEVTQDLKFSIDFSFDEGQCIPCQKAKEEREKNVNQADNAE